MVPVPESAGHVEELVAAICAGLESVLPAGIQVKPARDVVALSTPNGPEYLTLGVSIRESLRIGTPEIEAIRLAVISMLDELQDIVAASLTMPWPARSAEDAFSFAQSRAEIRGSVLRIWYEGNEGREVLGGFDVPLPKHSQRSE